MEGPLGPQLAKLRCMMPKAEMRLAILGAGPIGLEAALYARALQIPFTIFERGRVADYVWRWGHVRLFSPFGMNSTPLGRAAAVKQKPGQELPTSDKCLTGREHISAYLGPLAEALQGNLLTDTLVLQVGRRGLHKEDDPGGAGRAKHPFRILVRDKQNRERIEEADVVLDCMGTYGQHRWLGEGGVPAVGEFAAEPHVAYTLDDILGERKGHYVNKNVLVVGAGLSAATTVTNLAQIAVDNQSTWVTWLARGASSWPIKRIPNDPLKERDRLVVRANNIAAPTTPMWNFIRIPLSRASKPWARTRAFALPRAPPPNSAPSKWTVSSPTWVIRPIVWFTVNCKSTNAVFLSAPHPPPFLSTAKNPPGPTAYATRSPITTFLAPRVMAAFQTF